MATVLLAGCGGTTVSLIGGTADGGSGTPGQDATTTGTPASTDASGVTSGIDASPSEAAGLEGAAQLGDGASTTVVTFVSNADWPWFPGGLDGPDGGSAGHAALVCASVDSPPDCPQGAVVYGQPGTYQGWTANTSEYPGAYWIWRGDVAPDVIGDLQFAVFQKTFVLGSSPAGTIGIAADDFAEVRVNGSVAGTTGSVTNDALASQAQNNIDVIDLTPYLVEGPNTITIVGQNGPASFTGNKCSPCTYAVNTAGVVFGGMLTSVMESSTTAQ
jgi:hypothetical protein